jgi:hypothetical protein
VYTRTTELFAEWRPLVVGQATHLTAHFTHSGDRFRPYTEGKVTLSLTPRNGSSSAPGRRQVRCQGCHPSGPAARVPFEFDFSLIAWSFTDR